MAWTSPKTWSAEPLTSSDMNTYIRDNQNHLKDRLDNNAINNANEGSDYSFTDTSFADIDATEGKFKHTITTNGGEVLIGFTGLVALTGGTGAVYFEVDVDGSPHFGDDGCTLFRAEASGEYQHVGFNVLIGSLSAGSHIFKLQAKVSANTGVIYAGAGTAGRDIHSQFFVQEQ